jgi:hypothetical protein
VAHSIRAVLSYQWKKLKATHHPESPLCLVPKSGLIRCATVLALCSGVASCAKNSESRIAQTPQVILIDDCKRDIRVDLDLNPDVGLPPEDSAYLRLRVTDITSPQRASHVDVRLLKDGAVTASGVTDQSGTVQLRVAPGNYRLELFALGYQKTWSNLQLMPRSSQSVDVPIWQRPLC